MPRLIRRFPFARPVPATALDRVAPHRAGANGLGPLPAFSAVEMLMHANDDEGAVELIDVDLAPSPAAVVHGQRPDPNRAHIS